MLCGGCVIFCFVFILLTNSFFLKYRITALHKAAEKGSEAIVKLLVEHGSNVDLQNYVLIFFVLWLNSWMFMLFCWLCDLYFIFILLTISFC